MSMNTPQNKRILWDILKDNNVFENMKNTQYKEVKDTFDSVVEVTSKNLDRSNFSIVEKNKVIIENLIPAIEKIRLSRSDYYQQTRSNTTRNQHSRPTMQVVYDSDNMNMNTLPLQNHTPSAQSTYFGSETQNQNQNQRFNVKKSEQSDYNIDQYNKQKMERELTLDPKQPDVIDFTDKSIECDSPIGEDMDRLIAERLAARERELSLVPPPLPPNNNTSIDSKNGSSLQNNGYENEGYDNLHGEERKVTFSKEIEQINSNNHTDQYDTGGISSKLKLKRSVSPNKQIQGNGGHSDDRLILDADTRDSNYVSQEKFEALLRRVEHIESIVNKL